MSRKNWTTIPVNGGHPFRVVTLQSDWEDEEEVLAIVNAERPGSVWKDYDLRPTPLSDDGWTQGGTVEVPPLPTHVDWQTATIGGISNTLRCYGVLRARENRAGEKIDRGPVTLFATHCADVRALTEALRCEPCTIVDRLDDEEFGTTLELRVETAADVDRTAAIVGRHQSVPLLEDSSIDANTGIGIERLDRIDCDLLHDRHAMVSSRGVYGTRRGFSNWKFHYLPPDWTTAPLTWDALIANIKDSTPLSELPELVRQHVAQSRFERELYEPVGSLWRHCSAPAAPAEVATGSDDASTQHVPNALTCRCRVLKPTPPSLRAELEKATHTNGTVVRVSVSPEDARRVAPHTVVEAGGRWFEAVDTSALYAARTKMPGRKRRVSAALTMEQNRQIISAFYARFVEDVRDAAVRKACELVLFRYLVTGGYVVRWMGKYKQNALYVGNGVKLRRFRQLSQYEPDRLPSAVLNRLLQPTGEFANRGSKGTRSKYIRKGSGGQRYVPTRTLPRSQDDEGVMMRAQSSTSSTS